MKILLLGSNGMLGRSITKRFTSLGIKIVSADKANAEYNFDFTDDKKLRECVFETKPDIIINSAAIVDLDYCEKNKGNAYLVNSRIPGVLAEICKEQEIYLIQISTDHYYITGESGKHTEIEDVSIVNEYARTKYLGEVLALTYENALVLRTNIVGFRGNGKSTFIEWAIEELENKARIRLFNDFYTSSMHTIDFANILFDIIKLHPVGVYNLASSDVSSKKDFILALSRSLFGEEPEYEEASVSISSTKRATSLGLNTEKIEKLLGYKMPNLSETIQSIKKEYSERKIK